MDENAIACVLKQVRLSNDGKGVPPASRALQDELGRAVVAIIAMKLGNRNCDLWQFLRRALLWYDWQQPDAEIGDHVWGEKRHAYAWAALIAANLAHGTCDCSVWYQDTQTANSQDVPDGDKTENNDATVERGKYFRSRRKADAMKAACEQNHKPGPSWTADYIDRLHYAVHGKSNLRTAQGGHHRAFGNSMLCAVLTTPNGTRLYLDEHDNLCEDRAHLTGTALDSGVSVPVWVCHRCETVIGQKGPACHTPYCSWAAYRVKLPTGESRRVRARKLSFNVCDQLHFWPGRDPICPECSPAQECRDRKEVEIRAPRDVTYDFVLENGARI